MLIGLRQVDVTREGRVSPTHALGMEGGREQFPRRVGVMLAAGSSCNDRCPMVIPFGSQDLFSVLARRD